MYQSLEDLKKALEANEQTKTMLPDVEAFFINTEKSYKEKVDAEKQKGISEKNKVNKEAEGLRKYKIVLEKNFGFNPEEDDLETFAADLSDIIKKMKDGTGGDGIKATAEMKELQRSMAKMQKDFKKTQDELEAERKKGTELKIRQTNALLKDKIISAFKDDKGESKIFAPDLLAETLINSGKIKLEDDEKTVVFVEGSDTVDFEDGVKKILETRKDLIRNVQNGGSGSGGSTNQGGTGETLEQKKKRVQNLGSPGF